MKRLLVPLLSILTLTAACSFGGPPGTSTTATVVPSTTPGAALPLDSPSSTTSTSVAPQSPSPSPPPLTYPIGLEGELANVPAAQSDRYDWSQYGRYADEVMALYAGVGGRVGRINIVQTRGPSMPDVERYGFTALDELVAAYQRRGVNVAMTVAYQQALSGGRGVDLGQPWLWTNQDERARYETYLRTMLERYDGDGVDDAPGLLYPIRVWQIHNELEAQWATAVEQGATTWATPEDYATLLRFTAPIIREEIPDAIVVASQYPWPGRDAADFDGDGVEERYMERVADLGGYEGVDVVEIHDFSGNLSRLVDGLTYAQRASGLPVWAGQVLATNAPVGGQPDATPATQAEKVVKLLVGALAAGARHAHWWGLQNAPESVQWPGGVLFARSGLYTPCPDDSPGLGQVCTDPPLYPAGVNFRLLADAFVGYQSLTVLEPLALGVVPDEADSSRAVVRVERAGADPVVVAWDDDGGSLDTTDLFDGGSSVQVTHLVTEQGAEPRVEPGVSSEIPLSSVPVMITPGTDATGATQPVPTTTPDSEAANGGPKGAFIAFHLEVTSFPRIKELWPRLEQFMALADRYDVKVTLQFSAPWAEYVYQAGLEDTVHAWEANGHEIALHHHGPTHKFFDGYTNDRDAVRTDGWYATDGTYVGDMAALMALLAPLSRRGITSAGMSDEATDWPDGVLYFATDSGETPSQDDLLSTPVETVYNGHPVVEIYNAGYEIAHLGDAAVTLVDVEGALRAATPEQYLGIVFNDETIEKDFALIEPLLQLFQQQGVPVETVSTLLAKRG